MADHVDSQKHKSKSPSGEKPAEVTRLSKPEQAATRASDKGLHEVIQAQTQASKEAAKEAQERKDIDQKIALSALVLAFATPTINKEAKRLYGSEMGALSPIDPSRSLGALTLGGPHSFLETASPGATEKVGRGLMTSFLGIGLPMANEFQKMVAPENRLGTGTRIGTGAGIGYGAAMLAEAHPVVMTITAIAGGTYLIGDQIFNPQYKQRNKDIPEIIGRIAQSKSTNYFEIIRDAQGLAHGKVGQDAAYLTLDSASGFAGAGARSAVVNALAKPGIPIIKTSADGITKTTHPDGSVVEHHPAGDGSLGTSVVKTPDGTTIRTDLKNFTWTEEQAGGKTTHVPSEHASVRNTGTTKTPGPEGKVLHETPEGQKTVAYEKGLVVKNPNTNDEQFYIGADGKYYKFDPKTMKDSEVYPPKPRKPYEPDYHGKRQPKDDGDIGMEELFKQTRESALAKQAAKEQALKGEKSDAPQPSNKLTPYQEKNALSAGRAAKLPKPEELESLGILDATLKQGHLVIKTDPERALGVAHIEILKGRPVDVHFKDTSGKFHECKLSSDIAKRLRLDQVVATAKKLAFNTME